MARRAGRGPVSEGFCKPNPLSIQFAAMTLRAGVAKLAGAALAGLLIIAAPAAAKPCHPHHGGGNAEVAQYLETVPGPCGNQPIGGNGSGQGTSNGSGSGTSAAGLPPATISQLQSLGPAGQQAAGFAEATSPSGSPGAGKGGAGGGSGSASTGASTSSDSGGSLLSTLGHLLTGNNASTSGASQGLGTWLPILLGAVLVIGFGALALRRGRTG
jgi:hypothetical protein